MPSDINLLKYTVLFKAAPGWPPYFLAKATPSLIEDFLVSGGVRLDSLPAPKRRASSE